MLEGSKSDMDPDKFQTWIYKLMELNDIFESWPMKQMLRPTVFQFTADPGSFLINRFQ